MAFEVLGISPAPDTVLGKEQALTFDVRSNETMGQVAIAVRFKRRLISELVIVTEPAVSQVFEPGYKHIETATGQLLPSTVVPVSDPDPSTWPERFRYTIYREEGWLGMPELEVSNSGGAFEVPGPPGPEGPPGGPGPVGPAGPAGPAGTTALIPYQTVLGNPDPVTQAPEPITVHTELDWIEGASSWDFDGVAKHVWVGHHAALNPGPTTPFTVSAWVTTTSLTGAVFSKMFGSNTFRGWTLFVLGGAFYGALLSDTSGTDIGLQAVTTATVNNGSRHLLTMTYDGSTNVSGLKLYIDGVLQAVTGTVNNLTAQDTTTTLPVQIGARNSGEFFNGEIVHCSFFGVELSGAQVIELYNAGEPGDLAVHSAVASLRGWWRIDGTDNTNNFGVVDHSGNGRHGTTRGGLAGRRWLLDGVDDRVTMGDVLDKERTDAFSISGWFVTTSTGTVTLIAKEVGGPSFSGWFSALTTTGQLFFRHEGTPSPGSNKLEVTSITGGFNDGLMHQFVITKTTSPLAAGVLMYMDGVLLSTTTGFDGLIGTAITAAALQLGLRDTTNPFLGQLRDMAVWNRDLTALEVTEIYGLGVSPDLNAVSCASALQGWWVLDESDDSTAGGVADRSVFAPTDGTANFVPEQVVQTGSIPARGLSLWSLIQPGLLGFPLVSNGLSSMPSFRALAANAFRSSVANSILGNATNALAAIADIALGTNGVVGRLTGNIITSAIVNAQVAASALIALSKLATQAANTVVANATAGTAVPTAVAMAANTVFGRAGVNIAPAQLIAAQMTDAILLPVKLANVATLGSTTQGISFCFRVVFAAGVGATPDDVTVFDTPNQTPFGFRILDVVVLTTTSVAANLQLFSATGGGGTALSSVLAVPGTPGTTRNNDTANRDVAANTNIFLRRADNTVGGELLIHAVRIP